MRAVRWTAAARRSAELYLDYLNDQNPQASKRASLEIRSVSRQLTYVMTPGRPSVRWAGFREFSLRRWKKIIVFKILPDRISVVAFYDMRQDLNALPPPFE
ncbi:type II toxin-antitoxin system RelE/ParE family toxin [Brevundimonas sp. LM2]|uniref:type II toxin-antitoxin system RelE/ParE family toxin n=1 Tax=Brevundimonas sp. LM2 TaxID=1938605 RepID=UPI0015C57CA4|nr:type II toxin-antitoxin system RelE/ParE family toxin [Brevundimonas sp. LM2]